MNEEMNTYCKGYMYVPQNTQRCTAWAVKAFPEWTAQRNTCASGDKCPEDLLECPNVQQLNLWLSRFVTEVRKQDGLLSPPKSIQLILAGLFVTCTIPAMLCIVTYMVTALAQMFGVLAYSLRKRKVSYGKQLYWVLLRPKGCSMLWFIISIKVSALVVERNSDVYDHHACTSYARRNLIVISTWCTVPRIDLEGLHSSELIISACLVMLYQIRIPHVRCFFSKSISIN